MADNRRLGMLLVLTGAALAVWSFGDREADQRHEVSERISVVELGSRDGDVTIKVSDDPDTTIQEKRSFWMFKRGDGYQVDGETLRLTGDCGWNCKSDYVVTVPRGTKVTGQAASGDIVLEGVGGVDAKTQSGDVTITDVTGAVTLDTNSGKVELDNVKGALDIDVKSGDIKAERLSGGAVKAKTTSGDIELELAEANSVTATGVSGDIDITVPKGSYQVDTDATSGDVDNDLGSTADATHRVDARTTSGNISIGSR
ncbi:DUF4097 family beta strand repeat-containing protein [Kribbella deserti]|uniref:DUF4097 domain-containing protein n=1 Tax=Kribbella deserti TaxID=1926257 RepID=A0ABV6QJE9_9ACTN